MVEFPPRAIVSVPVGTTLPGGCRVAVRLARAEEAEEARSLYGERIHEVVLAAAALAAPDASRPLEALRVQVAPTTMGDLQAVEYLARSSHRQLIFGLRPDGDLGRLLNFVCGFDLPVHLDASYADPAGQALAAALDRFFKDPLQKAPIEPIGALARAYADGKGPSLWDTEREGIGRHYYVTDDGKVTLSERWARARVYFGMLDARLDDIRSSEAHTRLRHFGRELLGGDRPCMLCEHAGLCRGFLRACDPRLSCDAWKVVFARIRQEVGNVRELVKRYAADQRQV